MFHTEISTQFLKTN